MLFPHHQYDREAITGPKPKKRGVRAWFRRQYDDLWWTMFFITLAVSLAAARAKK
ncbi:MAG: hypothetical protein RL272_1275 [Candidatus Parcubacteria bacterium]